jgi:hypothetical protein
MLPCTFKLLIFPKRLLRTVYFLIYPDVNASDETSTQIPATY